MTTEKDLTKAEAVEFLQSPEFDAHGTVRLYGVIGTGDSAGQMVAIKSAYHLERHEYSRIYTKTNNGFVPIRKA